MRCFDQTAPIPSSALEVDGNHSEGRRICAGWFSLPLLQMVYFRGHQGGGTSDYTMLVSSLLLWVLLLQWENAESLER